MTRHKQPPSERSPNRSNHRSTAPVLVAAAFLLCLMVPRPAAAWQNVAAADSFSVDRTINLQQAIEIALANNTEMKRALLSVHSADQQVRTAWSSVMPDIALTADYTRNLEVPVNFIPEIVFDPNGDPDVLVPVAFGTDNNWSGGLTVSQTLFSGQAFVGISSSTLFKAAQSENLRAASQAVVTRTRTAYYQVLNAREQLRLVEAQLDRVAQNLEDVRARVEEGFADRYAVLQLEVQQSNLEPQRTSAEFAVENALRELLDTMGLPVHLSIDVEGNLSTFDIHSDTAEDEENKILKQVDRITPIDLETDTARVGAVADLRGDLRILDVQKQLQQKRLDAERSLYLPNLSASYSLRWSAAQSGAPNFFGTEEQRARSQTLMVNFSLPIFQGFARDAAIQTARIQLKDLEVQQYQARQTAGREIISARQSILETYENSAARRKALEQAELGYERALARYRGGTGSQQEVNDAELQLREAENSYAQMVAGYLMAKAQYDQAIGQVPFVGQDTEELKQHIELE